MRQLEFDVPYCPFCGVEAPVVSRPKAIVPPPKPIQAEMAPWGPRPEAPESVIVVPEVSPPKAGSRRWLVIAGVIVAAVAVAGSFERFVPSTPLASGRYKGTIDGKTAVDFSISRSGSTLIGSYKSGPAAPIQFNGHIADDRTFELRGYARDRVIETFKGTVSRNGRNLSGQYTRQGDTRSVAFSLERDG